MSPFHISIIYIYWNSPLVTGSVGREKGGGKSCPISGFLPIFPISFLCLSHSMSLSVVTFVGGVFLLNRIGGGVYPARVKRGEWGLDYIVDGWKKDKTLSPSERTNEKIGPDR